MRITFFLIACILSLQCSLSEDSCDQYDVLDGVWVLGEYETLTFQGTIEGTFTQVIDVPGVFMGTKTFTYKILDCDIGAAFIQQGTLDPEEGTIILFDDGKTLKLFGESYTKSQ